MVAIQVFLWIFMIIGGCFVFEDVSSNRWTAFLMWLVSLLLLIGTTLFI